MKKITLISLSTPTPFNCGAASALPYHLALYRPQDVELEIYSFDINQIKADMRLESEKALNAKIHIVPLPKWYRWMFRLHLLILRVFLKYPFMAYINLPKDIEKQIKASNPDAIWIYGEELSHISTLFTSKRCVVTTPDCEAMYYYRELCHRGQFTRLIPLVKNMLMYNKYAHMVEDFPTDNVRYHLVGSEDCDFLKNINPKADAIFIHHPHYDYSDKKTIKFSRPKIKILVAGRYDLYMKDKCDEVFSAMETAASELKAHYQITFLGKDWEFWSNRLSSSGYETELIKFAPDYQEELIKHDIQLTPIVVGTGTKGKVLDAFANGLMVMGTLRAIENIQVIDGESCVLYDRPEEAIDIFRDMIGNVSKYEEMAEAGRRAVHDLHGRQRMANLFFSLFK